jgi:hypothetical protein
MTMAALQDQTVQREGLVCVTYSMMMKGRDKELIELSKVMDAVANLRQVLPVRCTALHFCSNEPSILLRQVHIESQVCDRPAREVYHIHQIESSQDCSAKLQAIGILTRALPVPISHMANLQSHQQWLRVQGQKEMKEALETSPFYQQLQKDQMIGLLEPTPISSSSPKNSSNDRVMTDLSDTLRLASSTGGCSAVPTLPNFMTTVHDRNTTSTPPVMTSQQQQQRSHNMIGNASIVSLTSPASYMSLDRQTTLTVSQMSNIPFRTGGGDSGAARAIQVPPCAPSLSHIDLSGDSCSPRQFDVLFGRGKVKDHFGNIHLHKLIGLQQDRYDAAERWEKTVIAEEIVSVIRGRDGRFLKLIAVAGNSTSKHYPCSKKRWVEVDPETAREKVSHTFRSRRTKSGKPGCVVLCST